MNDQSQGVSLRSFFFIVSYRRRGGNGDQKTAEPALRGFSCFGIVIAANVAYCSVMLCVNGGSPVSGEPFRLNVKSSLSVVTSMASSYVPAGPVTVIA